MPLRHDSAPGHTTQGTVSSERQPPKVDSTVEMKLRPDQNTTNPMIGGITQRTKKSTAGTILAKKPVAPVSIS